MDEKKYLYHQLQLAAARLRTQADRMGIAAAGVSAAQAGALMAIASHPGATQRAIAQALGQGESAFATMVQRLLAADLVRREDGLQDPRAWSLSLSQRGQAALTNLQQGLHAMNARIDQVLSAAEQASLTEALSRLVNIDVLS